MEDPQRPGSQQAHDQAPDASPKAGLLATIRAIGWAFFGVRGRRGYDHDVNRLNPVMVILVGLALAAAFVLTLIGLARWASA